MYVSGVGTKSGVPDGGLNYLTTTKGCGDLTLEIRRFLKDPIDELVLDVFGFSRGAATARHFISREVHDENGALARAFKRQGIPWPKKITVRFLGLFDTVAGIADLGNLDFSAHDAETGRINVNLQPDEFSVCRSYGGKRTNSSGLGAGSAGAARPCNCAFAHC